MANLQEPPNHKKVKLRSSVRNRNRIHRMLQRQNPPDLCLDAIYQHIPLERLLLGSTELISKSWHMARTRALAKRQTLYLISNVQVGESAYLWNTSPYMDNVGEYIKREDGSPLINPDTWEKLKFDAVYLPTGRLTVKFTSYLLNKLPKITQLALVLESGDIDTQELEQVIRLLEHYSAHLVKLHLTLDNSDEEQIEPQAITRLFETINRLAVLEHLKLNHFLTEDQVLPPLSILSRLKSFSLDSQMTRCCCVDRNWLSSSLCHYANRDNLCSIGVGDGLELKQLTRMDPQIVGKFKWLKAHDPYGTMEKVEFNQMLQLCSQLSSLTCLEIDLTLPLNMLARCLAQVTSLIYLKLAVKRRATEPPNEEEPIVEYQVPSVLELDLYMWAKSHELNIAYTFPRLQVIQIVNKVENCSSCHFEAEMDTSREKVAQCRRLAREKMLAGCQYLHRIKYNSDDFYGESVVVVRS